MMSDNYRELLDDTFGDGKWKADSRGVTFLTGTMPAGGSSYFSYAVIEEAKTYADPKKALLNYYCNSQLPPHEE